LHWFHPVHLPFFQAGNESKPYVAICAAAHWALTEAVKSCSCWPDAGHPGLPSIVWISICHNP